MKLLIDLDEEYINAIDKIKFLVGGRTDRKLQLEIIKAIVNGTQLSDPVLSHSEISGLIYVYFGGEKYEITKYAIEAVKAVKESPQEPKTGHWIIKDDKEQGYDIAGVKTWYIEIMCSECGFIKTAIEGHTWQYHYCPNCGAKMIEPQKSEVEV